MVQKHKMAASGCCVLSPPNCNKSVVNIKLFIDKILSFLDTFGWLADVYLSDFFVCNYWEKLLPCWRSCFSQMEAPEIAGILSCKPQSHCRSVLPLSLLAYRRTIESLSLKRTKASDEELTNLLPTFLSGMSSQMLTMSGVTSDQNDIEDIVFRGGQYVSLDPHYRKHVKPKKQHEIDQMSKVIGQLCQMIGCDRIVDIGAGLGHLSRLLNFKYGLTVTTVEASSGHAPKAQKFDLDLKKEIKKKKKKMEALQSSQSEIVEPTGFSDPQNSHLLHSSSSKANTNLTNPASTNTPVIPNTAITQTNENTTSTTTTTTTMTGDVSSLPCHIVFQVSNTISPGDFVQALLRKNTESDPNSSDVQKFQSSSVETTMDHSSEKSTSLLDHDTKGHFYSQTKNNDSTMNSSPHSKQNAELSTPISTFSEPSAGNRNNSSVTVSSDSEMFHQSPDCDQPCREKNKPSNGTDKQPSDTMVLCGLHACGDLTVTILRMFVQSPHIAAIASVGCCYMKLTGITNESGEEMTPESIGYPMSEYLLSKKHCLSFEAREMACHFVDAYRKRLMDNCPSLQRHWYRAALQVVLRAVHPDFKHGCVKLSIKKVENLSFETYLEKALKCLGLDINDVPPDLIKKCKDTQSSWKEVVCFYTTRLSLAPVIETLILLDRVLHLNELGFGCALVPIFEPVLSPRNFLLLATKPPPAS